MTSIGELLGAFHEELSASLSSNRAQESPAHHKFSITPTA